MKPLLLALPFLALVSSPARSDSLVCHIDVDDPTAARPSLNMRIAPNAQSPIIGDLENGEHVVILSMEGRWAYVMSPKLGRGWMASKTARGRPYMGGCFYWDGKEQL